MTGTRGQWWDMERTHGNGEGGEGLGCGDRDTEGYRDGDTEMTQIWGGDTGTWEWGHAQG